MHPLARLLLSALLLTGPAVHAADWSGVWMESEAQELVAKGQLFRILLTPEDFGGHDSAANTIYVPAGIAQQQREVAQLLLGSVMQGNLDQVRFEIQRAGASIVPVNIVIRAWRAGPPGKRFEYVRTIRVWQPD